MTDFRPMLSGKAPDDLSTIRYPVLVSPKLDGIRCVIRDGVALSRNLKPIPNDFVRSKLAGLPDGLDGELIVDGGFNACQSAFMSKEGEPDFTFWVFDWDDDFDGEFPLFQKRLEYLAEACSMSICPANIKVVPHTLVYNAEQLQALYARFMAEGYEGAMIRDPNGPYKYGRSTTKEGYLLKLKQFETSEAMVIGAVERYHNENEATTDALGRTKRSSAKEGKVPAGDLGALVCLTPEGVKFEIGSGFTAEQRVQFWAVRNRALRGVLRGDLVLADTYCGLLGRAVTYRHQPDPTAKPGSAPRFPVFVGFRHEDDL